MAKAGRALALLLTLATPALAFVGGYPFAYGLMAASLILILWWLISRPGVAELLEASGPLMLGAALLIALALALTAREPHDLIYAGNFTMLALFPLIRAALARFASPGARALVARAAVAGTLIAAGVAVWQILGERLPRAQGFGSDPIWAAQAALVIGFLPLIGLSRDAGAWRLPYLLSPVVAIFVVLLCGSRGPLLAAVPLVAVAIALSRNRATLAIAFAITLVVGGVGAWLVAPQSLDRLQSILTAGLQSSSGERLSEPSTAVRFTLYRSSWEAFLEAPVAGHGWTQRLPASYRHVEGGEAAIVARDPMMAGNHHLHADILDLGVGAGLLGVAAYFLALLAPVAGALGSPHDSQRPARILGAALLATAYLACGLSYIMFGYEFPTTLYVVVAAILVGLCRDVPTAPRGQDARRAA